MRFPESVGLLIDIVAVPSPTRQEENAARMLCDRLPRFGWETSHIDGAGSVIATRGNGDKELVLLSHIDTVPGGPKFTVTGDLPRIDLSLMILYPLVTQRAITSLLPEETEECPSMLHPAVTGTWR